MRKIILIAALCLSAGLFTNCKQGMSIKTKPYPEARTESVSDNYFGVEVADPYRWLEDDNSAETAAWVAAENEVTQDYLSQIPYRGALRDRLTQLWDYPKYGTPVQVGGYYFYFENNGLQNQSVLYYSKGLDAPAEVFLDPNTLSADGTVALGSVSYSKDDKYMAYAVSASGSDWVEIKVMEIATRRQLPDVVKWVKFSGAAWSGDGFYYSRYDEPSDGGALSAQNRFQKVYYHKLGTDQSSDELIYEDREHPLRYFSAQVSRDDRQLFIYGSEGTSGTEVLYKDLTKPSSRFEVLFKGFENDYSVVRCKDDKAIVYTNESAPNFRLLEVDFSSASPRTKELVPQGESLMQGAGTPGGKLMVFYLENAYSAVKEYDRNTGAFLRDVALPGIGSVGGFSGDDDVAFTFYSFTGFTTPGEIYRYDLAENASQLYKKPEVAFDPAKFVAEQRFFESKDGTKVPMFIVHSKDLKMDGNNPLYLYGYGGFNISVTPAFSPVNILMMEQGAVYAVVNLRGGGEYGEQWHKAGMLDRKQNVFDDFIGAAEFLIAEKYTSPEKLAIAGGSNGGLLVGACMTQHPDLYAVALPAVGVMDMLRYHLFTVGWGWAVEYGRSDRQDEFEYLYRYSPLHNIHKGTCYPATMITTADHDDRVVPAHSFKFAATLQAAQSCDRPTLIRIETNAGHGAGKPTSKRIEEAADIVSFMFWNTGTKVR